MDIITHIPSLDLFRAECQTLAESGNKFFSYDGEILTYNISQIPVVYSSDFGSSVCLVRLVTDDEQETFDALETIERLGVCEDKEYIFNSDNDKAIYDSVYDQTPVDMGDGYFYKPPPMIGVFA